MDDVRLLYIVLNRNEKDNTAIKEFVSFYEVPSKKDDIKKAFNILKDALDIIYSPTLNENYLRQNIGFACNLCQFNETKWCEGNKKTKYYRKI